MLTFFRDFFTRFLHDESFFAAKTRAVITSVGLGGVAFADEMTAAVGWPGAARVVKIVSILCCGASLLLVAGDKTPENVKALADSLEHGPTEAP